MSVGAVIAVMFFVVSVILLGLEWLSRDARPLVADERPQRQQAPRRRR